MRLRNTFLAIAVIGTAALSAGAASAQAYYGYYGPYDGPYYGYRGGSYYSYGADRANPSFSPRGFDQTNPRDQQLQGHN